MILQKITFDQLSEVESRSLFREFSCLGDVFEELSSGSQFDDDADSGLLLTIFFLSY